MKNKIFIKFNENMEITFTHFMPFDIINGLNKTEDELLLEGALVESFEYPIIEQDTILVAKYNTQENNVYFEFTKIEHIPTEIELLTIEVNDLKKQNANILLEMAKMRAFFNINKAEVLLQK